MKIKEAVKLAVRNGKVGILREGNGQQWLNSGMAVYRLDGLPEITAEQICRMNDMKDEKTEEVAVKEAQDAGGLPLGEKDEEEMELPGLTWARLGTEDGETLIPIRISKTCTALYREELLKPARGREENMRYSIRTVDKIPVLAVKDGLFLQALIWPHRMRSEDETELLRVCEHLLECGGTWGGR